MRLPLRAAVVLAWILAANVVGAQEAPEQLDGPAEEPVVELSEAERTALARDQFTQGVRFARQERWQEASDRFGRALELRQTPQIRYNLAESLFHLGRLVEASEHVAILEGEDDVPRAVRRSLSSLRERIDERVGRLTLQVVGEGPDTRVTLDGRVVSPALYDVEMPVDPGRHVVRLAQGDREIRSEEVLVPEGGSGELRLEVPDAPSPAEAAMAAGQPGGLEGGAVDDDSGGIGPWWLWTAIAVVLVGGGAAAFLLLGGEEDPTQGDFMPGVVELP